MDPKVEYMKDLTPLGERLALCATKAGGKRALAKKIGLSEAQLFRYLRGESEPAASKIIAMANAAGLDAGWVLTGQTTSPGEGVNLRHDPELFARIIKTFEEALLEVQQPMSPEFKAQLVDIIYTDALMGQGHRDYPVDVSHLLTLFQTYFLMGIKTEGLKAYRQFMHTDYMDPTQHDSTALDPLVNHICRAGTNLFNTPAGQYYSDKMGYSVIPLASRRLDSTVQRLKDFVPASFSWLDLGCGNGREISYLHRHYENISVFGVDNAQACIDTCQQHINSKWLPPDSIFKADLRFLPFPAKSMDVVYSRQALPAFPYFPSADIGLNLVFKEVAKTLKPGGIFTFISRYGHAREYAYFQQLLSEKDVMKLAQRHGFEIIQTEKRNYLSYLSLYNDNRVKEVPSSDEHSKYDEWLDVTLRKF
jgi:SAM-dependent methyltransferase/transcriptional regulator with XRE-family HTH domain